MSGSIYSHYIEQTLPNYVQQRLQGSLTQLSNDQNMIGFADFICEMIEFCRKLCNRLQGQKQLNVIAKLLDEQIYPIRDAEKNNVYMLSIQDVYAFQIFLRLLCIMIQFESKKCNDNWIDYKEKFNTDLVKAFLMLKTINCSSLDQQFLELFQKFKSTSIYFYKYTLKLSTQFQLVNCTQHLRMMKLSLKKKQFTKAKNNSKQVDVTKQESKGECSNSCFEQTDLRIKDKRLQMMMNFRLSRPESQNMSFHDAFKQKENQKIINTTDSTLSRPSLCKRTINGGINGKYKLGNEIKVVRKTTSSNKKKNGPPEMQPLQILQQMQQLDFCREVSRKLLQLEEKKTISWKSEYLAPETDSDSGFN